MNQLATVQNTDITTAQWNTLRNSLYPGANENSVRMVVDYCMARGLDPLKKPCHIVPMQVRDAKTGTYSWRDVVMPGIYEYRTTATRTGFYLGHSEPSYGPDAEYLGVSAPAWCAMTVYRWNKEANMRAEYPVRILFGEIAATKKDKKTNQVAVNDRWTKAPVQMLTKCTEAAGLREAFPDELGGTHTVEEMEGQQHTEAHVITAAADRITGKQADDLAALIDEVGADYAKFLKYFKVEALATLPAARHGEAVDMLEAKRRAS